MKIEREGRERGREKEREREVKIEREGGERDGFNVVMQ